MLPSSFLCSSYLCAFASLSFCALIRWLISHSSSRALALGVSSLGTRTNICNFTNLFSVQWHSGKRSKTMLACGVVCSVQVTQLQGSDRQALQGLAAAVGERLSSLGGLTQVGGCCGYLQFCVSHGCGFGHGACHAFMQVDCRLQP